MIIAANWKAYVESASVAKKLLATAKRFAPRVKHTFVLAPPAPFLGLLASRNRSSLAFAAQDVSLATGGAHTGEITATVVREAGATYAIAGHSERRAAGEDNATVALKVQHILAQGMTPIVCVGERERDADARYLNFLREEISSVFTPLSRKDRARLVIAYEPIWAIGKTAADSISPQDLTEMVLYIRKTLAPFLPGKGASQIPILYGGSVEPDNARTLAQGSGVDGFLIGHAATVPDTFAHLIRALS